MEKQKPELPKIAVSVPEAEAAKMIGIDAVQVRDWVNNDRSFPAFKQGCQAHIPVRELIDWIGDRGKMRIGIQSHSSVVLDIVEENRRKRNGAK